MFFFVQFCKAIDRDLGDLIRDILELNKLATDYYSGDNDNNDTPEARTSRSSRKGIYPIEWSTFALVKETGDNALHYAARLGKCALVELLLDTGLFDVNDTTIGRHDQDDYDYDLTTADDNDNNNDNNSISDTNDTALTIACDLGWLSTIALLIERGAWLDHENGRSKTPLILATESIAPYDAHMCRMLLAAGADVNKVTRATANTCLLSACKFGDVALIGMLLHMSWHVVDGADGDLARITGRASPVGELVDGICDYSSHIVLYIVLGWLLSHQIGPWAWVLMLAAGASHAVQANHVEVQKRCYQWWVYGTPWLRQTRKADSFTGSGISGRLLGGYLALASSTTHGSARVDAAMLATEHDPAARERLRAAARAESPRLMPILKLLGPNPRAPILGLSMIAGSPLYYFLDLVCGTGN